MKRAALAAVTMASLFAPLTAMPAEVLRPPDAERLARLDESLGSALRRAYQTADAAGLDALAEAFAGPPRAAAPDGDWSCRWIKIGGGAGLVVYPFFRCRISERDGAWDIEKLTGSQRFRGRIESYPDLGWVYAGVAYVGDAPAVGYGRLPPEDQTPVEPNQTYAQVGVFERDGTGHARLLLPSPILESDFDIIELRR